ncbi:SH3 domain-containing protein [Aurantiacibacter odishensis]|uniref:SH3 domain-containing protein n=1 Tax=Aurantiacibacter odishensis TaxID=1155476 RepID=UPI000E74739E|nr:SH3 domain-containing protein [Aurantiacibacter odishensis]
MPRSFRLAACITAFLAVPATAQDVELPYWASIDAPEANMRVGAGEQFPIQWVYKREGLPVKVVRLMQGWRYVEEPDGTTGWISASLLSRQRTAIVVGDGLAAMREGPSDDADLRWNLEPGVVGELGDCEAGWCELDVDRHIGWVREGRLWGAGEP